MIIGRVRLMKTVKIFPFIILSLNVIGLLAVYSTDPLRGEAAFVQTFFGRQLVWCLMGWFIFWGISRIHYHWFIKLGWMLYLIVILSLIAVLLFGSGDDIGARRWLFFRSVQPSEFSKVGMAIFLAAFLSAQPEDCGSWQLLLKASLLSIIPTGLIFLEPDLGTALVIIILWFSALFFCGFHWKKILAVFAGLVGFIPIFWLFLHDYQKKRLLAFFAPQSDPLGTGYNVLQSQIAIGAGGFFGKGWLSGTQSQLRFLPAHYTDFIFASWCEQWGFVGGVIILALFFWLIWSIFRIGIETPDLEGKILTTLFGSMFVFQVMINVGMNMGVMPITGIPLPFISYGGSSLFINMIAMGMVWNIAQSGGNE
ncbi:MAG TPA: rod shape-determining protein RodA [Candidatus Atribacteria bacterium]|nr:rod shape-determining protein RodA [Candidatus Atribacteria bacterium]